MHRFDGGHAVICGRVAGADGAVDRGKARRAFGKVHPLPIVKLSKRCVACLTVAIKGQHDARFALGGGQKEGRGVTLAAILAMETT